MAEEMMTLREIEAELNSDERGLAKGLWAHAYGALLIRAVRQLGATFEMVREKRQCADCGYMDGVHATACSFLAVDPDVLALLEERGE